MPPGMRHLFDQQYFRAGVVGGDRRDAAGGAEADDDDIDFFVPIESYPLCSHSHSLEMSCSNRSSRSTLASQTLSLRLPRVAGEEQVGALNDH